MSHFCDNSNEPEGSINVGQLIYVG